MEATSRGFARELLSRIDPSDILSSFSHVAVEASHGGSTSSPPGWLMMVRGGRDPDSLPMETQPVVVPPHGRPSGGGAPRGTEAYGGDIYLVWAPYSYICREFPVLVRGLCSNHVRSCPTVEHESDGALSESAYITCIEVKCIDKIRRIVCPNRARGIVVYFLDSVGPITLSFRQGGITKFLESMRAASPISQSPCDGDDFIVYGLPEGKPITNPPPSERKNIADALRGASGSLARGFFFGSNAGITTPTASCSRTDDVGDVGDARRTLYGKTNGISLAALATKITGAIHSSYLFSPNRTDDVNTNTLTAPPSVWPIPESRPRRYGGDGGPSLERDSGTEMPVPSISGSGPFRAMGPKLTASEWNSVFVGEECSVDEERLEQAKMVVYMGGVDEEIRLEVWCFMLGVYKSCSISTKLKRQGVQDEYRRKYEVLTTQWRSIFPEQEKNFAAFREIRMAVEKDVLRTDRFLPEFAEETGEKMSMLRNVLMSHAMMNFDLGYCQGMSDILSPIVLLAKDEVEAFMCFSRFITNCCCTPALRDVKAGMEQQLVVLRKLVGFSEPILFNHLRNYGADDMFFCFRWFLVLFKREFSPKDAMLLWDVIVCCPYTPHFEVFVAAALLKAFAPQILKVKLSHDELLKFINSAANQLDVRHVIVLAQDFYLTMARRVTALDTGVAFRRSHLPTLDEMLQVLEGGAV